ncbi:MAG: MFS transporter, partial [Actinobacteria bacterium]|nr:MFS transporter [Actinomycetota bacterium]
MARLVTRCRVDADGLEAIRRPRTDLLLERDCGGGRFEAAEGPVRDYLRTVVVTPAGDGDQEVTQTIEFALTVPYFWWLFYLPFRRALARPGRSVAPWWAPPSRIDAQAASVLGSLAMLAIVAGYLNTLFTQTIAFAGEEFHAGDTAQGVAGAVVRVGGLVALVVASVADRRGRRIVLVWSAGAGCVLAATGGLAPSLGWLTTSQVLARAFATALALVIAIMAAEEMPAGSRAYSVSLLAMAAGFGAGVCLMSLRLADTGPRGWRLLYLVPLVALPSLVGVARRLPESRRFTDRVPEQAHLAGHGRRLWLLAVGGLLTNLFFAPQSQFANRFLLVDRGFSGAKIGLFSLVTSTPAVIGIVVGGRLADTHGRRRVAAFCIAVGALCTVAFFFSRGWESWAWAMTAMTVSNASIPALAVYGPELFPTSLRGRANGIVAVCALSGSALGLVAAGVLSDAFSSIGIAMACLALGPAFVAILVLTRYPETARRELEDLNPE